MTTCLWLYLCNVVINAGNGDTEKAGLLSKQRHSIGVIGRRLRANYLLDSVEAILTFKGGKRCRKTSLYWVTEIDALIVAVDVVHTLLFDDHYLLPYSPFCPLYKNIALLFYRLIRFSKKKMYVVGTFLFLICILSVQDSCVDFHLTITTFAVVAVCKYWITNEKHYFYLWII